MYDYTSNSFAPPVRSSAGALAYLRRVYGLFGAGILFLIAGGLVALYAGEPQVFSAGRGTLALPPIVAFGIQHPILSFLMYLGAFFGASSLRRTPGVNVVALLGYTFVTGIFLAPALYFAQVAGSQGTALSSSPVRDAFLLTGAAFTGLTSYVFFTRRDFSFMGAALSTGLWVVLGASLLGMFLQSTVFHLAVASVGVLLFAGYILYDTSRILRSEDEEDAVGAALLLFLDVVNLFISLLQILSSSSRRDS